MGEINVCRNSDDSPVTLTFASPVMEEQSSSYVPFLRPLNERNFFKRERICLSKDSFSKFSPLSKRGRANDFSSTLSPFFSTYIYNNAVTFFSSTTGYYFSNYFSTNLFYEEKKRNKTRIRENDGIPVIRKRLFRRPLSSLSGSLLSLSLPPPPSKLFYSKN